MALSTEQKIYRGFLAAAIGLLCMVLFAGRSAWSFREASHWVLYTLSVEQQIDQLQSSIKDAQISYRNYLLTGNSSYLESEDGTSASVARELAGLRESLADNRAQTKRLDSVAPKIAARLDAIRAGVALRKEMGPDAVPNLIAPAETQKLLDEVHQDLDLLRNHEDSLLSIRQARARRDGTASAVALAAGLVGCGSMLIMLYRLVKFREADALAIQKHSAEIEDLYNRAPCGYHSVDSNGVFLAINDTELEWLGYRRDEVVGRMKHSDLLTPESRARYALEFPKFKTTGAVRDFEFDLVRRDGSTLPVLLNATAILDAEGNYVASRTTLYDHTDRKRAEVLATHSLRYAESIVDTVREPLVILASDLRVRSANRAFYQVFDTKPEDTEDRLLVELGNGQWNIPHLLAALARIEPDHTTLDDFEVTRDFPRIGERTMALNARKLYRPGNNTQMLLLAIDDVTERKRVEQIHLHFRGLFESLPGLYTVLTRDFTIVAVSDAYLEATMTTREGILGRGLFEVFPDNPDDHSATGATNLRRSLKRVLTNAATDTMAIQKYDVRRPDGIFEERFWSPINSPVFGAERRVEYIIHRVEDVTDFVRQKAQTHGGDSVHQRFEQMEAEIFKSTQAVQMANDKLRIANDELEAFSYSVSHDLRAPLRHISGFAQMLERHLDQSLDGKARHYLHTIAESARQMGVLIDELLAFSRIGRTELRHQRVPLESVVSGVLQTLAPDITDRNIDWQIGPLPEIDGDPLLLRQVFVNLLNNAVKYTRRKEQARIEVGTVTNGDDDVIVSVKDNGAGFDPKYANKLFGVFQRLHTTAEFEGNGVGLATVRRIVSRHGGRVWGEGELGVGASFFISLPRHHGGAQIVETIHERN